MQYLTYAEAFRYLQDRFSGLTVGEFRAWVWGSALSPPSAGKTNNHYLPAYLRADLPPSEDQRFSWMAHVDNLDALEDAVFLEEDLVRFEPVTRYLTYAALVNRWAQYQPNVEAYIAKQAHTANSFKFLALDVLDRGTDAPLKDCVFSAKLVEAWEQAKFPDAATVTLTTVYRANINSIITEAGEQSLKPDEDKYSELDEEQYKEPGYLHQIIGSVFNSEYKKSGKIPSFKTMRTLFENNLYKNFDENDCIQEVTDEGISWLNPSTSKEYSPMTWKRFENYLSELRKPLKRSPSS